MKRTPINRYSLKKIKEMQAEAPIRIALCKRAGGKPVTMDKTIYRKGIAYTYTKVVCVGGKCECNLPDCLTIPAFGQALEPHEQNHRSRGGKLSLENTIMVLRQCHRVLQRSQPVWSNKC